MLVVDFFVVVSISSNNIGVCCSNSRLYFGVSLKYETAVDINGCNYRTHYSFKNCIDRSHPLWQLRLKQKKNIKYCKFKFSVSNRN